MKTTLTILALILVASFSASAQQPTHPDPLLDHLAGHWILHGTIAGSETTHDIDADWVLHQEYIRIHETSREKSPPGQPAYEAIVFIEWDPSTSLYQCLWLDSTGGGALSTPIAEGKRSGDRIAFVFPSPDGTSTHTTFAWNQAAGTWQWLMDNEEGGKLTPFARVELTRK